MGSSEWVTLYGEWLQSVCEVWWQNVSPLCWHLHNFNIWAVSSWDRCLSVLSYIIFTEFFCPMRSIGHWLYQRTWLWAVFSNSHKEWLLLCVSALVFLSLVRRGISQAFTAAHHAPSGWRFFHTQVWLFWFCCQCFCDRFGFSSQVLLLQLAMSQPLSLEARSRFVLPLPFDHFSIGGPTRNLCPSCQSFQGHWDRQITRPWQGMDHVVNFHVELFLWKKNPAVFDSEWQHMKVFVFDECGGM